MMIVFFEFDVGSVDVVVSVFCVFVASSWPLWLSSLNAPPSLLPPTASAIGEVPAVKVNASRTHAQRRAARGRQQLGRSPNIGRAYPAACLATNDRGGAIDAARVADWQTIE
jgi:hypothetical protein